MCGGCWLDMSFVWTTLINKPNKSHTPAYSSWSCSHMPTGIAQGKPPWQQDDARINPFMLPQQMDKFRSLMQKKIKNLIKKKGMFSKTNKYLQQMTKMCEKIVTPPFHFDHLPTQVPKSPYWLQGFESAIIFEHFFLGLAPTELFVSKKAQKIQFF